MREFSTVDLTQKIGDVTHVASREPVAITHHRKPRYVLMSIEDYQKMKQRSNPRQVYGEGETPPELAALIEPELDRIIAEGQLADD